MPFDPLRPDLAVALTLDRDAPRAARHDVSHVDRPSPDLRDAVVLLTSELVTQAVETAPGGTVELRVWMPADVVRVEMRRSAAVSARCWAQLHAYTALLLDQIADRWERAGGPGGGMIWFEIDRCPAALGVPQAVGAHTA